MADHNLSKSIDNRMSLQEFLMSLDPNIHVYAQQPDGIQMIFPAITYRRNGIIPWYADDTAYNMRYQYELIFISDDIDNSFTDILLGLPNCKYVTEYDSNNLHHVVLKIVY